MKPSRRIHLLWQTDRCGVGGASSSTMHLGNTRLIVPLAKESPRLMLHQCGRPPTTMNAVVGEACYGDQVALYTCLYVLAPDHPKAGVDFFP